MCFSHHGEIPLSVFTFFAACDYMHNGAKLIRNLQEMCKCKGVVDHNCNLQHPLPPYFDVHRKDNMIKNSVSMG